MYICTINLKPTTMTKEELRGFVKGAIASFNYFDRIDTGKYLNFILLEVNEYWLIEFNWLIVDIPSSNLDPSDDNSVQKHMTEKLKLSKSLSHRQLHSEINTVLTTVHESDLITERSEL